MIYSPSLSLRTHQVKTWPTLIRRPFNCTSLKSETHSIHLSKKWKSQRSHQIWAKASTTQQKQKQFVLLFPGTRQRCSEIMCKEMCMNNKQNAQSGRAYGSLHGRTQLRTEWLKIWKHRLLRRQEQSKNNPEHGMLKMYKKTAIGLYRN